MKINDLKFLVLDNFYNWKIDHKCEFGEVINKLLSSTGFINDVISTCIKYNKMSEKQAYCIAKHCKLHKIKITPCEMVATKSEKLHFETPLKIGTFIIIDKKKELSFMLDEMHKTNLIINKGYRMKGIVKKLQIHILWNDKNETYTEYSTSKGFYTSYKIFKENINYNYPFYKIIQGETESKIIRIR